MRNLIWLWYWFKSSIESVRFCHQEVSTWFTLNFLLARPNEVLVTIIIIGRAWGTSQLSTRTATDYPRIYTKVLIENFWFWSEKYVQDRKTLKSQKLKKFRHIFWFQTICRFFNLIFTRLFEVYQYINWKNPRISFLKVLICQVD